MVARENILGVRISILTMPDAITIISNWIAEGDHKYVCVTNAHGVMECQQDAELRNVFNGSGLTTPDGMSIVWLLRMMGNRQVERVYGPDLLLRICERSESQGWRHYFYGGASQVAEQLVGQLKNRYPWLNVVGVYSPPFRSLTIKEDREIIDRINAARPDIVWVGIGTPKQERWMAEHVGCLTAPVLIGVGAAFDFLSGTKKQAPRWMQRSGLEWLFRLGTEPRRLGKRYLQYPLFGLLILSQLLRIRRYPSD